MLVRHFGLDAVPGRRAPAIETTPEGIARDTGSAPEMVGSLLRSGKARLREARARRGEPNVEDTVYADRNGLMVSAYLEAFKVLGDQEALRFAVKTLDLLESRLRQPDGGLAHAYSEGRITTRGFLNDQLTVAAALLDAFEATGDAKHLSAARELVRYAVARFWDGQGGGFFDRVESAEQAPGPWTGLKPFLDDGMPAGNPLAAIVLQRLYSVTHDGEDRRRTMETLAAFTGSASRLGPLAATYGYALDLQARGSVRAVIVGPRDDARTTALWRAALTAFRPGKVVVALDPAVTDSARVPPPVAAMLAQASDATPKAYVCSASICSLPVSEPDRVGTLVRAFGRGQ